MYLVNICTENIYEPIWDVVGTVINIIWIGVPILLIVLGSIDLGKAVISSKEDDVKKAKKALINRFIYAALVFCVVWIVGIAMNLISGIGVTGNNNVTDVPGADTGSWKECWKKIRGK